MENKFWSENYKVAKNKFNQAIKHLKAKNINVLHEQLSIDELDPNDENLKIDITWIGDSNAEKIYMSTSGIHGVEGFTGSAIQLSILSNIKEIPKNTAFIFVHVLNPWGMSWLRRENESNVDLNRNFLQDKESYSGSHPHYIKLDPIINIKKPAKKFNLFNLRMFVHGIVNGQIKTKQAYAEGQYDFPKGLHFGGHKLEKGPKHFIDWLSIKLVNVKRCVWIDLHTGLGVPGEDALLVDLAQDSLEYIDLKKQNFGNRVVSLDPAAGLAYKIRGGMQKGVELRFPNINWTSIAQEFGTISGLSVIKSSRSESSWTHYSKNPKLDLLNHWTKKDLLKAFRPFDTNWENKIVLRGDKLFKQTLEYLLKY